MTEVFRHYKAASRSRTAEHHKYRDELLSAEPDIYRKRQKDRNFEIYRDEERMHQVIREQTWPMICLNDTVMLDEKEFQRLQRKLKADFDCILKDTCSYEL